MDTAILSPTAFVAVLAVFAQGILGGLPAAVASDPADAPAASATIAADDILPALTDASADAAATLVQDAEPAVRDLVLAPPPAADSARWWNELPAHQQQNLAGAAAAVIGNLPGVPMIVRDRANRTHLAQTLDRLETESSGRVGRATAIEHNEQLSMLREVEKALEPGSEKTERLLLELDTQWPGRASIALGDPTTARYVSYLIPGMFFTVEGQLVDWTDTAAALHKAQTSWAGRLAEEPTEIATVAWMGYETPTAFSVGSEALAETGALYLRSAMDALFTSRDGERPFVSLLAHSYGSTTAGKALATGEFQVDAFALVGSPGSAAESVHELQVREGQVYVAEANGDPVAGAGIFGGSPGNIAFGARKMSVAGGVDPITSDALAASFGHNEYFSPGSESLRNLALIGIGRGNLVSESAGGSTVARG